LLIPVCVQLAFAQTPALDRSAQRAAVNKAAVLIVSGHPETTMMKVADDLAIALSDPQGSFRVVPVVGDGSEDNIRDLILLRHIDLAITDLTALEKMKRSQDVSQFLQREIAHIVTLFPDKLQLFAQTGIKSVKDLEGKRVGMGLKGSSTELHSQAIFDALRVKVTPVLRADIDSAEALIKGDIDAFMCFCASSPSIYQRLMFNLDLNILPIPFEAELQQDYLPATIVHEDFPSMVGKGDTIDTIAVTLAIVTYNWETGSPRYAAVSKFVESLFNNLPKLQKAPRHPGWRSVQISATAAGWLRFAAAAEWPTAQRSDALKEMRGAFNEFLEKYTSESSAKVENSDQIKLFEEFLVWRQSPR
jgi:TRAP-type uncharacterized transport system substrate-binding protein